MSAAIQAYPVMTSCVGGEPIAICVASVTPLTSGATYYLRIVSAHDRRILYTRPTPLAVPVIPSRSHAHETGYGWPAVELPTDASWDSGLYYAEVAELTSGAPITDAVPLPSSKAFFVVRRGTRSRTHTFVIHWPFANAHAYSSTHDLWGRRASLYDSDQSARLRRVTTQKPLVDLGGRDITDGLEYGIGDLSPQLRLYDWMALQGDALRADACTSWDLHSDPSALDGYRVLILAGHDEYWSKEMRDHVEGFVARGGNVAVIGGNAAWWAIRYAPDGSQITCYKCTLEDPLLGIDDARVTANWSSAPTSRPENRLTGVATRRGCNPGVVRPLAVIDNALGLITDAVGKPLENGATFTAKIAGGGEGDGVELQMSATPVPTLRDGTPDTFHLVATNLEPAGVRPAGHVTMGYFTNNGTVFACPSTNWIVNLDDATVARTTRNVLAWLAERPGGAPAWGPSREVLPPAAWTTVETGKDLRALTAVRSGYVFATDSAQRLLWRYADLQTPWAPASLGSTPAELVVGLDAIGTMDVYGETLYIASGHELRSLALQDDRATGWTTLPGVADGETIRAVIDITRHAICVLVDQPSGFTDLRMLWTPTMTWHTLGDATGITALTGTDGFLVGATRAGRLVTRMAGKLVDEYQLGMMVDETWIDLGAAPTDTFALGHYFGRLYALAGEPGNASLRWRTLAPDLDRVPVDHGQLLFYDRASGACAVGRFLGNGDYENTNTFDAGAGWTHVVQVNDGLVVFYDAGKGTVLVGRVGTGGVWKPVATYGGFAAWTSVVGDGERAFFYRRGASEGYAGTFDPKTGAYHNEFFSDRFSSGWSHVVATWGTATGESRFFVFYAPDGAIAVAAFDAGKLHTITTGTTMAGADTVVPAGQLGVFLNDSNRGRGSFVSFSNDGTSISTHAEQALVGGDLVGAGKNGLIFNYRAGGESTAGGFSPVGTWQQLNTWGADAGFAAGWTHILGFGAARHRPMDARGAKAHPVDPWVHVFGAMWINLLTGQIVNRPGPRPGPSPVDALPVLDETFELDRDAAIVARAVVHHTIDELEHGRRRIARVAETVERLQKILEALSRPR